MSTPVSPTTDESVDQHRRASLNSDNSGTSNSANSNATFSTTSTSLPPFISYARRNLMAATHATARPPHLLIPPPPQPFMDNTFMTRLQHLALFDAYSPNPANSAVSHSPVQYRNDAQAESPDPAAPDFVNTLGLIFGRSTDDYRNLEDQLFASLRENDRLRDENRELREKVNPRDETEKERRIGFLNVIGELIGLMGKSTGECPDVHHALRNITGLVGEAGPAVSMCMMCMQVPATVVFRPCNHLIACASCTQRLMQYAESTPVSVFAPPRETGSSPSVETIVSNAASMCPNLECPRCRARAHDTLYIFV